MWKWFLSSCFFEPGLFPLDSNFRFELCHRYLAKHHYVRKSLSGFLLFFFFWKIISKYMLTCTRSLAWPLVSTVENLCTCRIWIFYSFCRWQHPISTTKGKSQVPIMCTVLVTQSMWNCSMNFMSPKQKTVGLMKECTLHT